MAGQEIISSIKEQLDIELTKLIDLELELERLEEIRQEYRVNIKRFKIAYDALTGNYQEAPSRDEVRAHPEVRQEAVEVVQERPVQAYPANGRSEPKIEPATPRIHCNACGGSMEPGTRELSNGRTVHLLVCRDSGCNNEQLA